MLWLFSCERWRHDGRGVMEEGRVFGGGGKQGEEGVREWKKQVVSCLWQGDRAKRPLWKDSLYKENFPERSFSNGRPYREERTDFVWGKVLWRGPGGSWASIREIRLKNGYFSHFKFKLIPRGVLKYNLTPFRLGLNIHALGPWIDISFSDPGRVPCKVRSGGVQLLIPTLSMFWSYFRWSSQITSSFGTLQGCLGSMSTCECITWVLQKLLVLGMKWRSSQGGITSHYGKFGWMMC